MRNVVAIGYEEFKEDVIRQGDSFVGSMVESLYAGDAYLIKGAFPKEFMVNLRKNVHEYCRTKPSEFHKMLEGSPDFHRIIDEEAGKKYSFRVCKHSCYFYPWNSDPLNLFKTVYERWGLVKFLMGLRRDEYEKNTPKDGVVDRIQVVRYPPKYGYLEPHSDPYLHQRLFLSGYMSKRGVDYQGLGFYLVAPGDSIVEIEDQVDVGDMGIGYAAVYHGVAPVDTHKEPRWDEDDGRWFLSMYSNASDEVSNRHTGHAVRLDLGGVTP